MAALSCAIFALATLVPARAHGAQLDEDQSAKADRLFREAEAFFDFGDIPRACATWADSLRIYPKLGTLLNLGLCHETAGRIATAWKEFHYGAAWAAQNGQKDRQKFAHDHAIALEPRLPRVVLQLSTDQIYSAIEIDGEPLPEPEWVLPFYVDPGSHTIAVTAPGKVRKVIPVNVTQAPSSQQIPIGDLDDLPRPPPPPPGMHVERTWWTTAGIVGVSAGGAMVLTSLYFGWHAADGRDDLRSRCDGNRCVATGIDAYKDVQSDANRSTVLAVAGILATGAGIGMLIYDPRHLVKDAPKDSAQPPSTPPKPHASFTIAPLAGGGAGLFSGGTF